jgi:hypothetical protein
MRIFVSKAKKIKDMKLWKYSGTFLWITGIIHIVVGFMIFMPICCATDW